MVWLVLMASACAPRGALPEGGAGAAAELHAFVDYFLAVHPEPHRFVSAEAFGERVAAEARTLASLEAPTELEIGRAFHAVLAPVADAHVEVGLELYQKGEGLSLLPVLPLPVGDTVLVDAVLGGEGAGERLVAIDHRPIETIASTLAALVIAEGAGAAPRQRELWWDFTRFYHLAYGMQDAYTLTLATEEGTRDITVDGAGREGIARLRSGRRSLRWGEQGEPWPSTHPLPGGGVRLRLPTFGVADMDAYRERVDDAFAEIGDAPALVLDLRGNEGGLRPNAFAVLDHLLSAPYPQWDGFDVKTTRLPDVSPASLVFPFSGPEELAQRFPKRTRSGEGDPLLSWMKPGEEPYPGAVYAFVDGRTGSAANTFVLALKRYRPDVTILGEELGGACDQHVGEFPVVYKTAEAPVAVLHSLIRIQHVAVEGCQRGRGLMPDVDVVDAAETFYAGVDPYIEALAGVLRE